MRQLGVGNDSVLLLRRKVAVAGRYALHTNSIVREQLSLDSFKGDGARQRDDATSTAGQP